VEGVWGLVERVRIGFRGGGDGCCGVGERADCNLQVLGLVDFLRKELFRDFLAVPPQTHVYVEIYIGRGQDFLWQVFNQHRYLSHVM
jgi:hypothetical protein